jgi:hypothetical protein
VFSEVLQYLIEEGYVTLENYFLDGTKIEANANKYGGCGRRAWQNTSSVYKRCSRSCSATLIRRIKLSRKSTGTRTRKKWDAGTNRVEVEWIVKFCRNALSG